MLTIYTPRITNRITYIMDVVLDGQLRLSFQLTESIEVLRESAYGITYAPQPLSIENEVFIWQHPVMSSSGVSTQVIDMGEFEGEPVFFQSPDNQSFLPFDIFAMSFYLLSRYEEYQPHRKDDYGRFPAAESIAFNNGFLHKPLVDILILKFAQKLRGQFGDALFAEAKAQTAQPQYIATYDIDHAYAYLHKGFVRTAGALAREILRFDIKEVKRRIAVLTGKQKDPFDTYDLIERIEREYALSQSIFFILFTGISQNDRGLNPKNKHFRQLIQRLRKTGKIACHPSFASSSSNDKLSDEISGLSGLLNESISVSRSHFLLLDFPETYQRYMANGIRTDFTMGYPELPGFRASTCKPFMFFDLSADKETPLQVIPLAYMDATLQRYMRLSPAETLLTIKKLINEVKAVNGTFVSLWHNENFHTGGHDWEAVYRESLDYFLSNS